MGYERTGWVTIKLDRKATGRERLFTVNNLSLPISMLTKSLVTLAPVSLYREYVLRILYKG